MVRAWCMVCRNTVQVPAGKIDRCPTCGRLYSLRLLPEQRLVKPTPISRTNEKPFDWVRVSIGWSMLATLLVIVWWLARAAHAAVRPAGHTASLPGIMVMLAILFLAIRIRAFRLLIAVAAFIIFTRWMWG
jgi:hypothetical protein